MGIAMDAPFSQPKCFLTDFSNVIASHRKGSSHFRRYNVSPHQSTHLLYPLAMNINMPFPTRFVTLSAL